jgi:hypothetical protein
VALEREAPPVVGHQVEPVAHVPGVDVGGVLLHQAERPVRDPQPVGRQRRGDHGAAHPARRRGIGQQRGQVVDLDGEHELAQRAVGPAPLGADARNVFGAGRRNVLAVARVGGAHPARHALAEADAGGALGAAGRLDQRGGRPPVHLPAALCGQQRGGPLAQRRDGEQRVDR